MSNVQPRIAVQGWSNSAQSEPQVPNLLGAVLSGHNLCQLKGVLGRMMSDLRERPSLGVSLSLMQSCLVDALSHEASKAEDNDEKSDLHFFRGFQYELLLIP